MKILDSGHLYELEGYDGDVGQTLRFMKREGPIYPGNVGHYSGTNIQEVLRVLIHRLKYLDKQIHSSHNSNVEENLRYALAGLEMRAAERHGLGFNFVVKGIENEPTCKICGHITCRHLEEANVSRKLETSC